MRLSTTVALFICHILFPPAAHAAPDAAIRQCAQLAMDRDAIRQEIKAENIIDGTYKDILGGFIRDADSFEDACRPSVLGLAEACKRGTQYYSDSLATFLPWISAPDRSTIQRLSRYKAVQAQLVSQCPSLHEAQSALEQNRQTIKIVSDMIVLEDEFAPNIRAARDRMLAIVARSGDRLSYPDTDVPDTDAARQDVLGQMNTLLAPARFETKAGDAGISVNEHLNSQFSLDASKGLLSYVLHDKTYGATDPSDEVSVHIGKTQALTARLDTLKLAPYLSIRPFVSWIYRNIGPQKYVKEGYLLLLNCDQPSCVSSSDETAEPSRRVLVPFTSFEDAEAFAILFESLKRSYGE